MRHAEPSEWDAIGMRGRQRSGHAPGLLPALVRGQVRHHVGHVASVLADAWQSGHSVWTVTLPAVAGGVCDCTPMPFFPQILSSEAIFGSRV